jgi:type I restriction enzyme, R subunit
MMLIEEQCICFLLYQYVEMAVYELDEAKLSPLLILKYKALAGAKTELGDIPRIRETFVGFQGLLYG